MYFGYFLKFKTNMCMHHYIKIYSHVEESYFFELEEFTPHQCPTPTFILVSNNLVELAFKMCRNNKNSTSGLLEIVSLKSLLILLQI